MLPTVATGGGCACPRRAALTVTSSEASNNHPLRRGALIVPTFIGISPFFASKHPVIRAEVSCFLISEQLTVRGPVVEEPFGRKSCTLTTIFLGDRNS